MLNNPAPLLYQNLRLAMENSEPEKPAKEKGGLLGPRKTMAQKMDEENDATSPTRRVASYMQLIQQKREELKNGRD